MTENVEIQLSTTLDSKGLDALRKGLNDHRNELNAVARETEKTTQKYKELKAATSELNRLIKLSDADLKKYAGSLIQTEQAVTKVSNSKTKLITNTDKLSKSFSNIRTNVGSYSSALVSMTGVMQTSDNQMVNNIGTIGLMAGGWISLATAIGLAVYNYQDWISENLGYSDPNNTWEKWKGMGSKPEGDWQSYGDENQKVRDAIAFKEKQVADAKTMVRERAEWEAAHPKEKKDTGGRGGKIPTLTETKVELNEIVKLQKQLSDLESISFSSDEKGQLVYVEHLKKVRDLTSQIAGLQLPASVLTGTGGMNAVGLGFNGVRYPIEQIQHTTANVTGGDSFGETASKTLDDTNAIYGAVSQTMNLLGVSTDTFVGQLVGGFNTVLQIMEIIKTVNTVLSFIPGFAEGGVASGLFMAGERGTELINVGNNSARVFNHNDTMRMLNNVNVNNAPVIYLSTNINPNFIDARIDKKNANQNYIRAT